jgi:4-aminobutyrate aminotransferase
MSWPPGSHASTSGGNPVSCRAALAVLDLVEREYLRNATERGRQLQAGLKKLADDPKSRLAEPRGVGLMQAVDVVSDAGLDPKRRDAIVQAAFAEGLLLLGCGKAAVRFCPSLCVTAEEVTTALDIFARVCRT